MFATAGPLGSAGGNGGNGLVPPIIGGGGGAQVIAAAGGNATGEPVYGKYLGGDGITLTIPGSPEQLGKEWWWCWYEK